jgi:hypothetical protein
MQILRVFVDGVEVGLPEKIDKTGFQCECPIYECYGSVIVYKLNYSFD